MYQLQLHGAEASRSRKVSLNVGLEMFKLLGHTRDFRPDKILHPTGVPALASTRLL